MHIKTAFQEMMMKEQAPKNTNHKSAENQIKGKAFLEANSKNPDVVTLPSGLQYKVIKEGEGVHPTASSIVEVHYHGTLIDGTVFDSSVERGKTIEFPLNRVIKGWTEGVQLMNPGSKYIFYIPSDLAYGNRETGAIPGGSTLIFEIELFNVK
ncbi:MAG: FKBP-type peptidyl-prolyl cis-trans isomerase [Bacteroidales bacterium]|nr:FKBP-type peptidyl-prolyl cis-trans isomerase [Bacteroidales bacterium]